MARVTVEDCLQHVATNYDLVLQAAKRARSLEQGAEALVEENGDKPTVIALRELAENITPESVAAQKEADALNEEVTTSNSSEEAV